MAAASTGDTIQLASGTYSLTQGSDIDITKSIALTGAGVGSTTIDGGSNSGTNQFGALARILRIDSGATVAIQDLTFSHGLDEEDENCSLGSCLTEFENGGGALFNNGGTVVLNNVAFTDDAGSGNSSTGSSAAPSSTSHRPAADRTAV